MLKPKLLSVRPRQLVANPWNTNIVSPENEAKLDASVKRNGLFKPVIVRETPVAGEFEVIGGEHRWQSAIRVGLEEIPIVNLGTIDDDKAKEIAVIDNARYGDDDMISYAELLKSLGDVTELQDFLPYTDEDFALMFSSSDIAIDDLDIDENFEKDAEKQSDPEPPAARAPKTHTIMRFKVSLVDSAKLTALIAKTQKAQGLTGSDDLTNAGDALVHLLIGQLAQEEGPQQIDDLDDILDGALQS